MHVFLFYCFSPSAKEGMLLFTLAPFLCYPPNILFILVMRRERAKCVFHALSSAEIKYFFLTHGFLGLIVVYVFSSFFCRIFGEVWNPSSWEYLKLFSFNFEKKFCKRFLAKLQNSSIKWEDFKVTCLRYAMYHVAIYLTIAAHLIEVVSLWIPCSNKYGSPQIQTKAISFFFHFFPLLYKDGIMTNNFDLKLL